MSATVPLLQADDAVRIAHVRAPRWISHPAAGAAHDAMRLLLERPPSLRPRGLLLAGPYHNGKTMIAERFAVEHLRAADQQKVWVIQTREGAGLSHFYCHCTLINQILRIQHILGYFCTLNCNISTGPALQDLNPSERFQIASARVRSA